jgi:hypothetical protein
MPETYQTHPQLQRTESHNWRLRNSALQTAHALIHISVLGQLHPLALSQRLRT